MVALAAGGVVVGLAGPRVALGLAGAIPLAIAIGALALLGGREPAAARRPAFAQN
jgi:hypothetical protein